MRRALVVLSLLVGAAVPAVALAAVPAPPPRSELTHLVCQRALDPPARAMSVTAVMRPVPGTARMAVNFHLLERPVGTVGFTRVSGPGLNSWIVKDFGQRPGDVWQVIHPVADLAAPVVYRFVVDFRWSGAGGQVLARGVRRSRVCRQPELRPDLVVSSVRVAPDPASSGSDFYYARIGNTGATAAGPFLVQLSDAGTLRDVRVSRLAGHALTTVRLRGPACAASNPPTVTVDPAHQVDVSSRSGAVLTASCPAP